MVEFVVNCVLKTGCMFDIQRDQVTNPNHKLESK